MGRCGASYGIYLQAVTPRPNMMVIAGKIRLMLDIDWIPEFDLN